jgi:MFS family permease
VALLFVANGAVYASLIPRFPEIKADLGLSNTAFGLSVAAFSTGALLSGLTASALVRRFGSAAVAVTTSVVLAALTVVAGCAPSAGLFAAALFVAGAADAVTDVAQNAHGLQVQRSYGRSIINSLHATWSVGAILGGGIGAAAIALHVPRVAQLAATAAVFGGLCLAAFRFLLPDAEPVASTPRSAGSQARPLRRRATWLAIAALALLAIAGAVVEDAGSSWASLYLRDDLGATPALATFGFIALVGFQFVGRVLGDRLVDRYSERAVVRAGGLLTAVGMGTALAFPTVPGTIAGFAMAGLGVASAVPAAFHGADSIPGLRQGTGLTLVTWLMRVGFLLSPITVGALGDAAGLRVGLLAVVAAGITIAVLASVLSPSECRADEFNGKDAGDDQPDARDHHGRQRFGEDHLGDERHQGNTAR